ncbi:response regulator transcription factor [Vibrio coralliilyticus]|uniref:response regulator transcription factor n=1 Tax=Vibrio coralliilyticus TaxID=190893 RepID=UPI000C165477|nr:response regulator transcription factor [Vibrio coralliilyticus]
MMKLLLIDEKRMFLDAIGQLLALENKFSSIEQHTTIEGAFDYLKVNRADVIVTDYLIHEETSSITVFKQRWPETKIIILSEHLRSGYIKKALEEGCDGYISKSAKVIELVSAIDDVLKGHIAIEPRLAVTALRDKDPLTDTEKKLLRLVGRDKSNREIAEIVCLGEGTVRNYMSVAMSKLFVSSRGAAYRKAHASGWL